MFRFRVSVKKCIFALCLLCLCGNTALAQYCMHAPTYGVLMAEDGSTICEYNDVVQIDDTLFAAGNGSGYALMDDVGNVLTDFVYDYIDAAGSVLRARSKGIWCILNRDGEELCENCYTKLIYNGSTGFWALKGALNDGISDMLYIINESGFSWETDLRVRRTADDAGNGRLSVQLEENGEYVCCDGNGHIVIEDGYNYIGSFVAGLACARRDALFGVLDTDGATVLSFEYDKIEISQNGLIFARDGQHVYLFDENGNELLCLENTAPDAGLVGEALCINDGQTLRLYASDGALLYEGDASYSIYPGINGQYIVSEGSWGEKCVGLLGMGNRYQNLVPLSEDTYLYMQVRTARYFADALDETRLSVDPDAALYGIVDRNGEIVCEAQYKQIEYLGNGRYSFWDGETLLACSIEELVTAQ